MINQRRNYLIDKKLQFKYTGMIVFAIIISILTVSFTTFYIIWNRIIDEFFGVPGVSKKIGEIFIQTSGYLFIPIFILIVIFSFVGIMFSHRIAGPLYRIKKIADAIANGNLDIEVRFRETDEIHDVADALNRAINGIKQIVKEDREIINKLVKISNKLKKDLDKQRGLKKDIKDTIFKLDRIIKKLERTTNKFKI